MIAAERATAVRPPQNKGKWVKDDGHTVSRGTAAVFLPSPRPVAEKRVDERTINAPSRPMARRGSKMVRRAQERPMMAAVLVASFVVSLTALYVGEYARVAAAGLDRATLTQECRVAEREEEGLRAEISRLTLASTVKARAESAGMQPNTSQTARLIAAAAAASPAAVAPVPSEGVSIEEVPSGNTTRGGVVPPASLPIVP